MRTSSSAAPGIWAGRGKPAGCRRRGSESLLVRFPEPSSTITLGLKREMARGS